MNKRKSSNKAVMSTLGKPAALDGDVELTLGLLTAIHSNEQLTQRRAAGELGVALGLVNTYIKRCIKKGYIKVSHAPANRYAYYLTPKGFAEKSRLTARYLSDSFDFFRSARSQCSNIFSECTKTGWCRIGLIGMGDLTEIAILCAHEYDVELCGIVDPDSAVKTVMNFPVVAELEELGAVNAVVVTDLLNPQAVFDHVVQSISEDRVFTPSLLKVFRDVPSKKQEKRGQG